MDSSITRHASGSGRAPVSCLLLGAFLILVRPVAVCGGELFPENPSGWPAISRECRPWCYNWWLGNAVDTNNLARELSRYREAGFGGIHIIPIYGAKGFKSRFIDYLSPQWMELLRFSVEEAGRLDLGVDMTTGTGWCFGGPNVPLEQGCLRIETRVVDVAAGQEFNEPLPRTNLMALLAETTDRQRINLLAQLPASGAVKWSPGETAGKVTVVTIVPGGSTVKRAAPGNGGPMLNPFYRTAMTNYLERFSTTFNAYRGPLPRSMYHDSYEYNSSWTPDLLAAFARRRGYRLEEEWPAFCGDPRKDEMAARVRADFKETLSDLMIEDVFPEWIAWCRARGMLTRNQAHGSPANLLDLYALADMPETEMFGRGTRDPLQSGFDERFGEGDREPLLSKFASSAAHIAGRPRVAAETGTWMAEHFCETLEEMKCLVDLFFVAGVNHVFYHGTCFSPDDVPWPGWLFYASTQMNPRNAIWHDAPALNSYIARCQSILQSGRPDNDVLLYWPIHDGWHSDSALVTRLTVHQRAWLEDQPIGACARRLWERGYEFDYVSDRLLTRAQAEPGGRVTMPGANYRAIVVPATRLMPEATLRKLISLAEAGATVIFENHLPTDVPGQGNLAARRVTFKNLLQTLATLTSGGQEVRLGRGRVLLGEVDDALSRAQVPRETITDHGGTRFIRRLHDDGRHYFIANQSVKPLSGWFALATPATSVVALDPLSGRSGLLPTRPVTNGCVEIPLRLEPGQSIFLRTFTNRDVGGTTWRWPVPGAEAVPLSGPWQLEFISGGPNLPKACQMQELKSWTLNGDPETERFGGTAVYRTKFDLPATPGLWLLDLGQVCHSARVRVNGRDLGTLLMHPYRLPLESLNPTGNTLEVEVTNLSANRIRDLDRNNISWRNFYDANVVNINYKPFDASQWPLFESGLLGPVRLISANNFGE